MEKEENILGHEKISKLIIKFSVPCIISLLVNSLYNIVDQIFIGQGVGYLGNGATNVVFPLVMIGLAFSLMFGDGASSYLSLKLGEKKQEEAQFPHLDELLSEIVKSCNQMLAILKFEKKRTEVLDDLEFVLNSIIKACEKRDLMVVNGLVIGLNYVSKKFRNIRHLVSDLNNLIYDYYEYLAGNVAGVETNEAE